MGRPTQHQHGPSPRGLRRLPPACMPDRRGPPDREREGRGGVALVGARHKWRFLARLWAPLGLPRPPALSEPKFLDFTGLGRGWPRRWRTAVSRQCCAGQLRPIQARYELHRPQAHLTSLAHGAEIDQRGLAKVALNSGETLSWRTRLVWWLVPVRLWRHRALHLRRIHYDQWHTPCAP
jgi:hypothetical protein